MTPLRQRVIKDMQLRNLDSKTQPAYLHCTTGLAGLSVPATFARCRAPPSRANFLRSPSPRLYFLPVFSPLAPVAPPHSSDHCYHGNSRHGGPPEIA